MPSPNLVASYVVFIIVGCFSFIFNETDFVNSAFVKWSMVVVLLSNATYYFYYEMYSEHDASMIEVLKKTGAAEWFFRVIGQCILYSLWFLLDFGWIWFHIGLVSLYIVYIFWSILVWDQHPKKWLPLIDLAGLMFAGIFMYATQLGPNEKYFIFGIVAAAYLGISIAGIAVTRFNPFKQTI
uniref:Uncharacterized protein n=1 Tax=Candidatus Kentrum sp. SD TaxID=2126332 RepID=A0A451BRE8_9GAMM|nr:MAG: hypothetical protein BECKSD772D_GA0070982_11666 [Candidatus Kentron sp. SD]